MKTNAILSSAALILAATLSVPAHCRAQDTVHGGNYQRGGDPLRSFNQTSTGPALSSTFSGSYGQGSMSVSHGAGDLIYISTSGNGKAGYRNGDLSWTDTVTINPNDPALWGTSGTAKFTYHLDGSMRLKTSADSIRDLVRQVAVLPPVKGVLRRNGGARSRGLEGCERIGHRLPGWRPLRIPNPERRRLRSTSATCSLSGRTTKPTSSYVARKSGTGRDGTIEHFHVTVSLMAVPVAPVRRP